MKAAAKEEGGRESKACARVADCTNTDRTIAKKQRSGRQKMERRRVRIVVGGRRVGRLYAKV